MKFPSSTSLREGVSPQELTVKAVIITAKTLETVRTLRAHATIQTNSLIRAKGLLLRSPPARN